MAASYLEDCKKIIESDMVALLGNLSAPDNLKASMVYSVEAGGKRIRPALLFAVLEACGASVKRGLSSAQALELVHTYSLIHDDLPAMDDDSLRRGKPTNHIVFGEAMAILAGDGLLTHAFGLIAKDKALDADTRLELIGALSLAAGPEGMVAGQVQDIEAERSPVDLDQLKEIHKNKTGRLLEFAVHAGSAIAKADEKTAKALQAYASHLGLAFQIKDDILDVEGSAGQLGKTPGKDASSNKSTYVSLLGLKGAKKMLGAELAAARESLCQADGLDHRRLIEFIEIVGGRIN